MSALKAVLTVLGKLTGSDELIAQLPSTAEMDDGARLLERNTKALFGLAPAGRNVRIMVTMPVEAATDSDLVRNLLLGGMDCMRINCAHDGPEAWSAMIAHVRQAEKETSKHCKIAMDIAGPKLRTGPVGTGPPSTEIPTSTRSAGTGGCAGPDLADASFQSRSCSRTSECRHTCA